MKHLLYTCAAMSLLVACGAHAGEALEFGPVPTWVRPVPVDPGAKTEASAPAALLNLDSQAHFSRDGDTYYSAMAIKVQAPTGLSTAQPEMVWNPEISTVTIHRVHILRDGKVIDVLAAGQTFTVLRRESNLESSMLDGNLTAVLQPEGLQVGDIVDYAYSIVTRDPVMQGRSELLDYNGLSIPAVRLTYRAVWDKTKPMRWQASPDYKDAKLSQTAAGSELSLDLRDYMLPEAQDRVPGRFTRFGVMAVSEFGSWTELSALLGPLYVKASTLTADSPLRAEVDKIRAAHADPKAQAAAALRLVEEQVRYVFIGTNQGGYVPADAELTWQRRFGDCKGKSALLLALLKELGIEADAVAVSTWAGDGMNESLPMIELFDHVIVRAVIGGKTYWLDGTRMGDTNLETLPVARYDWALPMREGGTDLVPVTLPAPDRPITESHTRIDASAGLDAPAPIRMELIYRGDDALDMHRSFETIPADEFDSKIKETWKDEFPDVTLEKIGQQWDPVTGEQRLILEGKAKIKWLTPGYGKPRQFLVTGYYVGGGFDLKRKDGLFKDAPVSIAFPHYERDVTTVILPHKGKGFAIAGEAVDKTLAGYAMKRSFSLKDGVFTLQADEYTTAEEVPVAEVLAAEDELDRLGKGGVYIQAPHGYKATEAEVQAATADEPKTAEAFIARGREYADAEDYDKAIADYDAAVKLDPKSAKAITLRGYARAASKDLDGALADYTAALAVDPRETLAYRGRAVVYYDRRDYAKAIEAVGRILDISPADPEARAWRASLYLQNNQYDRALDDALTNVAMQPESTEAIELLAAAYAVNNQNDKALEVLREAVVKYPDDAGLQARLGAALLLCPSQQDCDGRRKEAVEALGKAIALEPSVSLYLQRASARPESDRAARLADIDAALDLQPDSTQALFVRANVYLSGKDYDLALADANSILAGEPDSAEGYGLRGTIHDEAGRTDAALADLDKALELDGDNPGMLNNACWVRAINDRELDRALELCNAALKLAPNSPSLLDSRAMVYLKMARWEEARADYQTAIDAAAFAGAFPSSLYGRGIARLRMGQTKDGRADLAEAKKHEPDIAKRYADHGIKP